MTKVERTIPELTSIPGFAGHFLDNANGGTFVVQFQAGTTPASLANQLEVAARSVGGDALDVELREVDNSSADLTEAMNMIWMKADEVNLGKAIAGIAEDPIANGLVVSVADADALDRVNDVVTSAKTPATLEVSRATDLACTNKSLCDSPRRGGVGVFRSSSPCTVGWVMVRNGVRGAITAGHCWFGTNSGAITSGGNTYGSLTTTNALTNGTHADMRWISIPSNARPWIYASNAAPQTVVTGQSLGTVGSTACQFGANASNPRCGTITSTNSSHVSNTTGYHVYGQYRATFAAQAGDSGGSVASSTTGKTARGIVAARVGSGTAYTSIGYSGTYNMGALLKG